jgi:hypothetical protein
VKKVSGESGLKRNVMSSAEKRQKKAPDNHPPPPKAGKVKQKEVNRQAEIASGVEALLMQQKLMNIDID